MNQAKNGRKNGPNKWLSGLSPQETPPAALELYSRHKEFAPAKSYERIPWSTELVSRLSRQYRDLRFGDGTMYAGWLQKSGTGRVWHVAEPALTRSGRITLKGRCHDFATILMLRYMALDIPRGALSIVLCRHAGIGHVILDIHTDRGDLIACNIVGLVSFGDGALRHHRYTGMEWGDQWQALSTKSIGLDQLLPGNEQ